MARFGAWGDLVFEVSSFRILTFDNYKRKTSHRYAKHEIMNYKPKLESVGNDLEEVELQIKFMTSLGVNPIDEMEKLRAMCRSAEVNYLIIGTTVIGDCLFVLEEISEQVDTWDGTGNILASTVNVKFKEYAVVGDF